jgi:hypothetical protein
MEVEKMGPALAEGIGEDNSCVCPDMEVLSYSVEGWACEGKPMKTTREEQYNGAKKPSL